jgi:hypothetical protein
MRTNLAELAYNFGELLQVCAHLTDRELKGVLDFMVASDDAEIAEAIGIQNSDGVEGISAAVEAIRRIATLRGVKRSRGVSA